MNPQCRIIIAGVFLVTGLAAHNVRAQVAEVTAVENVVEKQSQGGTWVAAKKGTELTANDTLRTAKRSKAEIRFGDGSVTNLGQLSSLSIQAVTADTTRVLLNSGRILFVAEKGDHRSFITTSSGAAAVKSGTAMILSNPDGSAEYTLYSGALTVSNRDGTRTVDVPVGQSVRTNPDNTITEMGPAPPLLRGTRKSQIGLVPPNHWQLDASQAYRDNS